MRRRPANSSIALIHPTCTVHTSIIHAHRHIFCVILSSILDRVSMAHRENPPFAHIHMSFSLYALCRQCRLYILCDYLLFVRENLLSVLSSHDDECDPNSCWITAGNPTGEHDERWNESIINKAYGLHEQAKRTEPSRTKKMRDAVERAHVVTMPTVPNPVWNLFFQLQLSRRE